MQDLPESDLKSCTYWSICRGVLYAENGSYGLHVLGESVSLSLVICTLLGSTFLSGPLLLPEEFPAQAIKADILETAPLLSPENVFVCKFMKGPVIGQNTAGFSTFPLLLRVFSFSCAVSIWKLHCSLLFSGWPLYVPLRTFFILLVLCRSRKSGFSLNAVTGMLCGFWIVIILWRINTFCFPQETILSLSTLCVAVNLFHRLSFVIFVTNPSGSSVLKELNHRKAQLHQYQDSAHSCLSVREAAQKGTSVVQAGICFLLFLHT